MGATNETYKGVYSYESELANSHDFNFNSFCSGYFSNGNKCSLNSSDFIYGFGSTK